jgi:hypothetical protein
MLKWSLNSNILKLKKLLIKFSQNQFWFFLKDFILVFYGYIIKFLLSVKKMPKLDLIRLLFRAYTYDDLRDLCEMFDNMSYREILILLDYLQHHIILSDTSRTVCQVGVDVVIVGSVVGCVYLSWIILKWFLVFFIFFVV